MPPEHSDTRASPTSPSPWHKQDRPDSSTLLSYRPSSRPERQHPATLPANFPSLLSKTVDTTANQILDNAQRMIDRMQTRAELYATIDYSGYEALDESIVKTLVPHGMPQRGA